MTVEINGVYCGHHRRRFNMATTAKASLDLSKEYGRIKEMGRLNLINSGATLMDHHKMAKMSSKELEEYWTYLHDYLEAILGPQAFDIIDRLKTVDIILESRR